MWVVLLLLWHLACLLARADDGLPPPPAYNESLDSGVEGRYPKRLYHTVSWSSPVVNFLQYDQRCDDGLKYFITPRGWSLEKDPGPMILDGRGEVVWFHHYENQFGGEAYNFMMQKFHGEDVLTLWLGDDRVRGHGAGYYYLLNSSYDIITKIGGANGLSADLHEFLLTPEGTALMTLYQKVPTDVTSFRSFDSTSPEDREPNWAWDGVFQEINVDTGELLFEWRAKDHIDINDTYRPIYNAGTKPDPFDWYHINSVDKDELGNYLISARYTHSITYVDGKTKKTIWELGGKKNSFMDLSGGNATNFAWQHDARFHTVDTFPNLYTPPPERDGYTTKLVSLFDNAAEDQHYQFGLPLSRGLLLEVTYPTPGTVKALAGPVKKPSSNGESSGDLSKRDGEENAAKIAAINGTDPDYTVRVIMSYDNPNNIRSSSQGSMKLLPQGAGQDPKVLVGYGLDAAWTEFDANGTVLCDVHYGASTSFDTAVIQSYRTFKFDWVGRPRWKPNATISDDDAEFYVSWNGATDVKEWVLQCSKTDSENDKDWKELLRIPRINFETTISIPESIGDARYLRAVAFGGNGKAMEHGASEVVDRGIMASYMPVLNQQLSQKVSNTSPLKIFFIVMCNVSILFIIYEIYRRYLSWRIGRPGAGPLRWRKDVAYQILGDA